jgi:hypothetical protein
MFFITYSTIITTLIESYNVIVVSYFKGPRVKADICTNIKEILKTEKEKGRQRGKKSKSKYDHLNFKRL